MFILRASPASLPVWHGQFSALMATIDLNTTAVLMLSLFSCLYANTYNSSLGNAIKRRSSTHYTNASRILCYSQGFPVISIQEEDRSGYYLCIDCIRVSQSKTVRLSSGYFSYYRILFWHFHGSIPTVNVIIQSFRDNRVLRSLFDCYIVVAPKNSELSMMIRSLLIYEMRILYHIYIYILRA